MVFRFFIFLCLAVSLSCAKSVVSVSILPQQYIVEKIAGDTLEVLVMVAQGANHETYEPKPNQMRLLAKSDIYFALGLPFEKVWLDRFAASSPKMSVIDTSAGVEKTEMQEHHHDDEHDEHGDDEDHDELDPHIWLDPILLKVQAKNFKDALCDKYPQNAPLYTQNYENFAKELDALHAKLSAKLAALKNRSFLVFHPSWGYFARRYDLNQIFVEVEGKEPKAAQLIAILKNAKTNNIKALLVEPQVSFKNAKIAADEIGAKVVNIDPLKKDIARNLDELADTLLELER
ncbi:MAG: zinc ABC transporter substrate-binding protein [Campylobacteraceae bacterium]|nr:zinc ABC transporter substrate-binding protein [Campylobacteraceae bacterium]